MAKAKYTLPSDYLSGPAPNPIVKHIDFKKSGIPEYAGCYAVILDGILSAEECKQLLKAAEATTDATWERAMINIGSGVQMMAEDTRKCGRIIWDKQSVVDGIWARCAPLVPEIEKLSPNRWPFLRGQHKTYSATRLNERMRILKYTGGEYFKKHYDGTYMTPDGSERSFMTLHLYLNDADHQEDGQKLEGGATAFYGPWGMFGDGNEELHVSPKIGSVLIFQHAKLLHSGDDVISGTKYTMRTDLMYKAG